MFERKFTSHLRKVLVMTYFDLQVPASYKIKFGGRLFNAFFKRNSSSQVYRPQLATVGKSPQFFPS